MEHYVRLFADTLIDSEDNDRLNHFSYAQVISAVIRETSRNDSLNIGIFGPWGIGKSSIMSMVQESLSDKEYCCININAWRLAGDPEALRRAVVLSTRRALGIDNKGLSEDDLYSIRHEEKEAISNALERLFELVRDQWYKVRTLFGVIVCIFVVVLISSIVFKDKLPVEWLSIISNLISLFPIALFGSILQYLFSVLSGMKVVKIRHPIASVEQFADLFDELVSNAVKENKQLVYFVDDVDRLSAEQLVATLKTVKAFFDRPGCIFVISCHDAVLAEAVAIQLEKEGLMDGLEDVGTEQKIRDYIDKIFQVKVYVNPASEDDTLAYARRLVHESQLEIDDLDNVLIALIHANISTPRQVKRQLNDFLVALRSAELRARGAVRGVSDQRIVKAAEQVLRDTAMLAKLVTIRTTWPALYDRLLHEPQLLWELTSAAVEGRLENELKRAELKLSSRDESRLQGYLVRTRHIHNQDLVSFLYLRPSDAAVLLGTDEVTREIWNAAQNGDIHTVRKLLEEVEASKYALWLDYLLYQIRQSDSAIRNNLVVSTSVVLALVEESVLEKRCAELASEFVPVLSDANIRECVPEGIVRALVNLTEPQPNIVTSWLEENILNMPLAEEFDETEAAYLLALLRYESKLGQILDGTLHRVLLERLHDISAENFDRWAEFVGFCIQDLAKRDFPHVRSILAEVTLRSCALSDRWTQCQEIILQIWPIEEPLRVDWMPLVTVSKEFSHERSFLDNLSSLAWKYASALNQQELPAEIERDVIGILATENAVKEQLLDNDGSMLVALGEKLFTYAPDRIVDVLVATAAGDTDGGEIVATVIDRLIHHLDQRSNSPAERMINAILDELDETLTGVWNNVEQTQFIEMNSLYRLFDVTATYAPGRIANLLVAELNRVSDFYRRQEGLSASEKLENYRAAVMPLLPRLLDLVLTFPDETSQSVSDLRYCRSVASDQAYLVVALQLRASRRFVDPQSIVLSMRHSLEGAINGILVMLAFKDWSEENWSELLAELVGSCGRHEELLQVLTTEHGVNVLYELRSRFGTYRAVVGRLVMAKPEMLSVIDNMVRGVKGYANGALEGLARELENAGKRDEFRVLEEVILYLKPLLVSDRKVKDRIFGAWRSILGASRQPEVFRQFVTFYESREMLEGNLQDLDDLLREVLSNIPGSLPPEEVSGLIDAIDEIIDRFGRSTLKPTISRVKRSLEAVS